MSNETELKTEVELYKNQAEAETGFENLRVELEALLDKYQIKAYFAAASVSYGDNEKMWNRTALGNYYVWSEMAAEALYQANCEVVRRLQKENKNCQKSGARKARI